MNIKKLKVGPPDQLIPCEQAKTPPQPHPADVALPPVAFAKEPLAPDDPRHQVAITDVHKQVLGILRMSGGLVKD